MRVEASRQALAWQGAGGRGRGGVGMCSGVVSLSAQAKLSPTCQKMNLDLASWRQTTRLSTCLSHGDDGTPQ